MKTAIQDTLTDTLRHVVNRGLAQLLEPPRQDRYGQPSGMIELHLAQSAALAEAARRALHAAEGAP